MHSVTCRPLGRMMLQLQAQQRPQGDLLQVDASVVGSGQGYIYTRDDTRWRAPHWPTEVCGSVVGGGRGRCVLVRRGCAPGASEGHVCLPAVQRQRPVNRYPLHRWTVVQVSLGLQSVRYLPCWIGCGARTNVPAVWVGPPCGLSHRRSRRQGLPRRPKREPDAHVSSMLQKSTGRSTRSSCCFQRGRPLATCPAPSLSFMHAQIRYADGATASPCN